MKRCPFCAEEIQDAAIKCRFCNSFLSSAPPAAAASPAPAPAASPAPSEAAVPPFARANAATATTEDKDVRKTFYEGVPSWKAFLGHYAAIVLGGVILMFILLKLRDDGAATTKILNVVIPVALAVVFWFGVTLYRKSIKFRVTNTVIETERGILSKSIDVMQLWRCRDVRYRQTLIDRILGIAHVEVFAQDATTPHLEITGMPASRQLFEQLRDSIELQRKDKNIYGVVS